MDKIRPLLFRFILSGHAELEGCEALVTDVLSILDAIAEVCGVGGGMRVKVRFRIRVRAMKKTTVSEPATG
jgi:hypothetical protein